MSDQSVELSIWNLRPSVGRKNSFGIMSMRFGGDQVG